MGVIHRIRLGKKSIKIIKSQAICLVGGLFAGLFLPAPNNHIDVFEVEFHQAAVCPIWFDDIQNSRG